MRSGRLFIGKPFQRNVIFDENSRFNRDNAFLPYITLREYFRDKGVDLVTQDKLSASKSLFDIYINNISATELPPDRSFLLVRESPVIRADNFTVDLRGKYAKVFSWSKNHKNADNVVFVPLSKPFPVDTGFSLDGRKNRAVIIAGNKISDRPGELYTFRDKLIEDFQANEIDRLDLYGHGWDLPTFRNLYLKRLLTHVPWLFRVFHRPPSIYKGSVPEKGPLLRKYWFSICLENTDIDPEYISEKIFDSIFSGTIPLYYGARNIERYVPKELFIKIDPDCTSDEIVDFMDSITLQRYEEMQAEMSTFIEREREGVFSPEYFASTIVSNVLSIISR